MFKFIKYTALSCASVYALSWIVAIYFKISLTPQKINSKQVNPKVLEYAMIFKGSDPLIAETYRRMYEDGVLKVDKNGMLV